jgi:hypothetical protein
MFGKDRGSYVRRDVLSDDEDMEADARVLEKEELRRSVCPFLFSLTCSLTVPTVRALRDWKRRRPWRQSGFTSKRNAGRK